MVGNEKSQLRLIVQYIGMHSLALALTDIGRIAHHGIPTAMMVGRAQGILAEHPDSSTQTGCIVCRHTQCIRRDIPCLHSAPGSAKSQAHCYATAASADIQH